MTARLFTRFVPLLFVLLWASGFVVARLVRPYAEPFSFIALRFCLSAALLAIIAVVGGARWPVDARGWSNGLVAGALMQGAYVGGVFWSVKHGLPAAVAALISGLQPLLTGALASPLLGERVDARRWTGIGTGFAGALLVLAPNLAGAAAVPPVAIASCLLGTVAITLGTIWQKRIGGDADLRSGAAVQFLGGLGIVIPLMLLTEHIHVGFNADVWFGLGWSVIVLSVIAALLFLSLIKAGEVAGVASLFYLVPPVTALMAFLLFREALVPIQFVGMGLAAVGVVIANPRAAGPPRDAI